VVVASVRRQPISQVIATLAHHYTRELVAAAPELGAVEAVGR